VLRLGKNSAIPAARVHARVIAGAIGGLKSSIGVVWAAKNRRNIPIKLGMYPSGRHAGEFFAQPLRALRLFALTAARPSPRRIAAAQPTPRDKAAPRRTAGTTRTATPPGARRDRASPD